MISHNHASERRKCFAGGIWTSSVCGDVIGFVSFDWALDVSLDARLSSDLNMFVIRIC